MKTYFGLSTTWIVILGAIFLYLWWNGNISDALNGTSKAGG